MAEPSYVTARFRPGKNSPEGRLIRPPETFWNKGRYPPFQGFTVHNVNGQELIFAIDYVTGQESVHSATAGHSDRLVGGGEAQVSGMIVPAAYTRDALSAMLGRLGIQLPDPDAVVGYLQQHPDTTPAVTALCKAMRERFPLPAKLSLELYADPEIAERHLALYLRLAEYPPDILDRIEDAYLPVAGDLATTSGWVIATTDYQPG